MSTIPPFMLVCGGLLCVIIIVGAVELVWRGLRDGFDWIKDP